MKTRAELLESEGYWIAKIQIDLFHEIEDFKKKRQMNNVQLAEYLGCTKGYVSQLLNGDFDHKISKLVKLSLAMGKVPKLDFIDLDEYINDEKCASTVARTKTTVNLQGDKSSSDKQESCVSI